MLDDLEFSDLYLVGPQTAYYKLMREPFNIRDVEPGASAMLRELWDLAQEHKDVLEYTVSWRDTKMRVAQLSSVNGMVWVFRRLMGASEGLAVVGFQRPLVDALLSPAIKHGLVLFVGKTGVRKTTSLAAWAQERLERFGGVCWTLENPVEMDIEGPHGQGRCFQMECETDAEFTSGFRRILRAAPNMILIGEIRDPQSVRDALRAATSGHLVGATFHSNDIISAITSLVRMAGDASHLAEALAAVVHLQIVGGSRKSVQTSSLIVMQDALGEAGVRANIRGGQIHMLSTVIEQQRMELLRQMQTQAGGPRVALQPRPAV